MSTLSNQKIKNSFQYLIQLPASLSGTVVGLQTGTGEALPVSISTSTVKFTGVVDLGESTVIGPIKSPLNSNLLIQAGNGNPSNTGTLNGGNINIKAGNGVSSGFFEGIPGSINFLAPHNSSVVGYINSEGSAFFKEFNGVDESFKLFHTGSFTRLSSNLGKLELYSVTNAKAILDGDNSSFFGTYKFFNYNTDGPKLNIQEYNLGQPQTGSVFQILDDSNNPRVVISSDVIDVGLDKRYLGFKPNLIEYRIGTNEASGEFVFKKSDGGVLRIGCETNNVKINTNNKISLNAYYNGTLQDGIVVESQASGIAKTTINGDFSLSSVNTPNRIPYISAGGLVTSNAGLVFSDTTGATLTSNVQDASSVSPALRTTVVSHRDSTPVQWTWFRGRLIAMNPPLNVPSLVFGNPSGPESSGFLGDGFGSIIGNGGVGVWTQHNPRAAWYTSSQLMKSDTHLAWCPGNISSLGGDAGFIRESLNTMRVSNGSTGVGNLITGNLTVRQPLGTAGVNEVQIFNDGSSGRILAQNGLRINGIGSANGQLLIGSSSGTDVIALQGSGTGGVVAVPSTGRFAFSSQTQQPQNGIVLALSLLDNNTIEINNGTRTASGGALRNIRVNELQFAGRDTWMEYNGSFLIVNGRALATGGGLVNVGNLSFSDSIGTDGSGTVAFRRADANTIEVNNGTPTASGGGPRDVYLRNLKLHNPSLVAGSVVSSTSPVNFSIQNLGGGPMYFDSPNSNPIYFRSVGYGVPFQIESTGVTATGNLTVRDSGGTSRVLVNPNDGGSGRLVLSRIDVAPLTDGVGMGLTIRNSGSLLRLASNWALSWTNSNADAAQDTELTRSSAGFVGIGSPTNKVSVGHNGTAGWVSTASGHLTLAPWTGQIWLGSVGGAGMRNSAEMGLAENASLNWTNGTNNFFSAPIDARIRRSSANVLDVDTGTNSSFADVRLRDLTLNTLNASGNLRLTAWGGYVGIATGERFEFPTGGIIAHGRGTTNPVLRVRGVASQAGNLLQLENNAGTTVASVSAAGAVAFGTNSFVSNISGNLDSVIQATSGVRWGVSGFGGQGFMELTNGTITGFPGHLNNTDGYVIGAVSNHPLTLRAGGNYNRMVLPSAGGVVVNPGGNSSASVPQLIVRGSSSQTGNLQEWQNSAGSARAYVDASGTGVFNSAYLTSAGNSIHYAPDAAIGLLVGTAAASNRGLVVRGVASQTGRLTEWQDSAGGVLSAVNAQGRMGIFGAPDSSYSLRVGGSSSILSVGENVFEPFSASLKPLVIKGASSQTANLTEWQNNAGTVLASVSAGGGFTAAAYNGTNGSYALWTSSPNTYLLSNGATHVPLVIRGASGQTGDLQQWQNNAGSVLASVQNNGQFVGVSGFTGGLELRGGLTSTNRVEVNSFAMFGLTGSTIQSAMNRANSSSFSVLSTGGFVWGTASSAEGPGGAATAGIFRPSGSTLEVTNGTPTSSGGTLGSLNVANLTASGNGSFGSLTSPGSGSASERIGAGASTSTFANCTAIGSGATVTANGGTAIGQGASAGMNATAVGRGVNAPTFGTYIGNNITGNGRVGVGIDLVGNAGTSVLVGTGFTSGGIHQTAYGIGGGRTLPAVNFAGWNGVSTDPSTGYQHRLFGTSSTAPRDMAATVCSWTTATDASRATRVDHSAYDFGTAETGTGRTYLSGGANGSAPVLGFYGVTPVARQTVAADATDLASALALINDLKAKLIALGLVV